MKKRKFNLLLEIATICLCVAAIAFGVYSAKSASLNVSGTLGFTAHNCNVIITPSYTCANSSEAGASVKTTTLDNVELGNPASQTSQNVAFDSLYFNDLVENGDKIVLTLKVENKSMFDVKIKLGTLSYKNGENEIPEEKVARNVTMTNDVIKDVNQTTEEKTSTITITLTASNIDDATGIDGTISINVDFSKKGKTSDVNGGAMTVTTVNTKQMVNITYGSNTQSGLSYAGTLAVPKNVYLDGVEYETNIITFENADYTKLTTLDLNANKVDLTAILKMDGTNSALKEININVVEDLEIVEGFNDLTLNTVNLVSGGNIKLQTAFSLPYIASGVSDLSFTMQSESFDWGWQVLLNQTNLNDEFNTINSLNIILNNVENNSTFVGTDEFLEIECYPYAKNFYFKNVSGEIVGKLLYGMVFNPLLRRLETLYVEGCEDIIGYEGTSPFSNNYVNMLNGEHNDMLYILQDNMLFFLGKNSKEIPNDIKGICWYAMSNCGLSKIELPSTVTAITKNAFNGYTGATSITFKGTQAEWNAAAESGWNTNSSIKQVVCSDGTITL